MRKGKFWFRNEKRAMKMLGFEPVQGSGSGWVHKEDGENDNALAQLKSTEKESYRVSLVDLEKLEYHASVSNKIPVFVIEFLGKETYAMINIKDFYRLRDLALGREVEKTESGVYELDVAVERERVVSSSRQKKKFYEEEEARWNKKKK